MREKSGMLGERLDNDPNGTRYGCFLPDLTGLARRLPAPTSRGFTYERIAPLASPWVLGLVAMPQQRLREGAGGVSQNLVVNLPFKPRPKRFSLA